MKQKEVFKKIGGIIKELSDQYEYLETVIDDLNDLELELFVSNAHFLTDHIEILCKLNLQNKIKRPAVTEKPELSYQQKYFEPVVQQMKHATGLMDIKPPKAPAKPVEAETIKPEIIKLAEDTPVPQIDLGADSREDTYSYIREEPKTIRHELILDEATNWDDDELTPVEEEIKEPEEQEEPEIPVIAEEVDEPVETIDLNPVIEEVKPEPVKTDTAEEEVVTINQKMSAQAALKTEQQSIKPISDIKLAITLNDKLLYVKDLFNGYNLAYSEAIEILNRFNTFEEASRFLKTNYVTKNNWESKPSTTEKFYALLKRRYA
jgi:hypothetical protein